MLFVLNVVIFGRVERDLDDDAVFFLPHSGREQAKILWRDGAAVGFYTTKAKGEGRHPGAGSAAAAAGGEAERWSSGCRGPGTGLAGELSGAPAVTHSASCEQTRFRSQSHARPSCWHVAGHLPGLSGRHSPEIAAAAPVQSDCEHEAFLPSLGVPVGCQDEDRRWWLPCAEHMRAKRPGRDL